MILAKDRSPKYAWHFSNCVFITYNFRIAKLPSRKSQNFHVALRFLSFPLYIIFTHVRMYICIYVHACICNVYMIDLINLLNLVFQWHTWYSLNHQMLEQKRSITFLCFSTFPPGNVLVVSTEVEIAACFTLKEGDQSHCRIFFVTIPHVECDGKGGDVCLLFSVSLKKVTRHRV